MQLKTKKIIALQGLIFLFSTIGWLIVLTLTNESFGKFSEFLAIFIITLGIINFIIWAIRVLLRKEERR